MIRTFQLPQPAAEGGTMDEKLPRILPKVATSTSLLGSFTCRKFTTWDRRLYFPSEGRRAEYFFARKIRRFRPGLNRELGYHNRLLPYEISKFYVPLCPFASFVRFLYFPRGVHVPDSRLIQKITDHINLNSV